MEFTGTDWALIITAATGFLSMLGTQIASLMVSLNNSRKIEDAKVAAVETKSVIDGVKVAADETKSVIDGVKVQADETKAVVDGVKLQTDGLTAGAIAAALAQGAAEGNVVGRKEVAAEIREADETVDHIPNRPHT